MTAVSAPNADPGVAGPDASWALKSPDPRGQEPVRKPALVTRSPTGGRTQAGAADRLSVGQCVELVVEARRLQLVPGQRSSIRCSARSLGDREPASASAITAVRGLHLSGVGNHEPTHVGKDSVTGHHIW